ncbi:uncharacterized protein LOC141526668 [Cotesia typhae]|uniref:uncharacterized protein LOC141526668 n=1 Tax=Cotesia typhae TaxID=2053667 RepID=UPI003D692B81
MLRHLLLDSCFSIGNEPLEDGCRYPRCPDSNHHGCHCARNVTIYRKKSLSIHQAKKTVNLPTVRKPMPELEYSLLYADLPEQLSENRNNTNHVFQVRERCLPSEPKYPELQRVQQADRASERHQFSGTEEQVLDFYSNSVHLPSKNNVRDEKLVKKVRFLPTIYENVTCTYSDSFK